MNELDPSINIEKTNPADAKATLSEGRPVAVIGMDEFKEALIESRNPSSTLGKFMAEATAYRESLIKDGRSA